MFKTGDGPSIESVAEDLSGIDLKNPELEAAAKTIQARFRRNQEAAIRKNPEENESENLGMKHEDSKEEEDFDPDPEIFQVGLRNYWSTVNHIALVVSDIGKSLGFYAGTIGMTQVIRPDFDRHGAWLTFGNVDLHLIKGRPAVHADDDLIVSHIAIVVEAERMEELRVRLNQLGTTSRRNVSVPNPADQTKSSGKVSQAFVRDPDGYYIEFCACEGLENYLKDRMKKNSQEMSTLSSVIATNKFGKKMIGKAAKSKKSLEDIRAQGKKLSAEKNQPDWMRADLDEGLKGVEVDEEKLANLIKRRKTYCDITQNASEEQLIRLLKIHSNHIPAVIEDLELWVRTKGSYTVIPPAFYERDGKFHQPASFEIPVAESAPASLLRPPSSNEPTEVKSKRVPGFEDTAKNIQGRPEPGDGNEKVV